MGIVATLSSIPSTLFKKIIEEKKHPHEFASDSAYLDKSWDIISFILTGRIGFTENNVLSEIIHPQERYVIYEGEVEYMNEYLPYSSPERVKEINKELQLIGEDEFKALFENREFKKGVMYAEIVEGKSDDIYDYLKTNFISLKSLFEYAANNNEYVVLSIE